MLLRSLGSLTGQGGREKTKTIPVNQDDGGKPEKKLSTPIMLHEN